MSVRLATTFDVCDYRQALLEIHTIFFPRSGCNKVASGKLCLCQKEKQNVFSAFLYLLYEGNNVSVAREAQQNEQLANSYMEDNRFWGNCSKSGLNDEGI